MQGPYTTAYVAPIKSLQPNLPHTWREMSTHAITMMTMTNDNKPDDHNTHKKDFSWKLTYKQI